MCSTPQRGGVAQGTVDSIHVSMCLDGAEGSLELVASVSLKSKVLMGQK